METSPHQLYGSFPLLKKNKTKCKIDRGRMLIRRGWETEIKCLWDWGFFFLYGVISVWIRGVKLILPRGLHLVFEVNPPGLSSFHFSDLIASWTQSRNCMNVSPLSFLNHFHLVLVILNYIEYVSPPKGKQYFYIFFSQTTGRQYVLTLLV